MHVAIDRAGRVVIPKLLREQLGFSPDRPLEAEVVGGQQYVRERVDDISNEDLPLRRAELGRRRVELVLGRA